MKNRIAAILVTAMLSAVIISGCGDADCEDQDHGQNECENFP